MRGAPPSRRWAIAAASFRRRLLADLLDGLLWVSFVVVTWRSGLVSEPMPSTRGDLLDRLADLAATDLVVLTPAVTAALTAALCYAVATRAWLGGTFGERALGLRLIGPDGGPCGPFRALVHALCALLGCAVFGIGYTWALVDRERRTLAEHLSGARLIRGRPRPAASPRAAAPGAP
ncbi:RDD family protein [Myxococcota bacterium]|nr:RDD family protein [Myxococcota bacterium]